MSIFIRDIELQFHFLVESNAGLTKWVEKYSFLFYLLLLLSRFSRVRLCATP